jgi:hypothetical protein
MRALLAHLAARGRVPEDYDVTRDPIYILPLMTQECRATCYSRRIIIYTEPGSHERSLRGHEWLVRSPS